MKCDIYSSEEKQDAFLFVPEGTDVATLPQEIISDFGKPVKFRTVELSSGKPLMTVDPNIVLDKIKERGFHVQESKPIFKETV